MNAIVERETTAVRGAEPQAWAVDPWVAMIERAARDPAIDADKMIKLYELSERAAAARSKAAYAADFALMQAKLPRIDRKGCIVVYSKTDREKAGGVRAGDTPQQQTAYARLEDIVDAIAPALSEHGFSLSHRVERTPENMIAVTGILMHRDGHSEQTCFPLPHDSTGSKNNVQAIGSSITYGRRYTILSLLNIVSHAPMDVDDDAKRSGHGDTIGADDIAHIEQQLRDTGSDKAAFLKAFKIEAIEDLTLDAYKQALTMFARKKAQTNDR